MYNKLISDARASVPFLITDSCVHISKEGQVKKSTCAEYKVQKFHLQLLANCIWYTVMFCILGFWPYVVHHQEKLNQLGWILYYHYFIVCYLYNTTAGCVEPTPSSRGSIDNFQSAAEGTTITYSCSPGLVPRTRMSAVCINMTWRPDPATLECREPLLEELGKYHSGAFCQLVTFNHQNRPVIF